MVKLCIDKINTGAMARDFQTLIELHDHDGPKICRGEQVAL